MKTILDHSNNMCITHIDVTSDGKYLASAGDNKEIIIWKIDEKKEWKKLIGN